MRFIVVVVAILMAIFTNIKVTALFAAVETLARDRLIARLTECLDL